MLTNEPYCKVLPYIQLCCVNLKGSKQKIMTQRPWWHYVFSSFHVLFQPCHNNCIWQLSGLGGLWECQAL